MKLEIDPLPDAPFGALVSGWEPAQSLDDEDQQRIVSSLQHYRLLVFRGQPQPTDEDLVRFVESFGDPIRGSEWFRNAGALPEILPVTNIRGTDGNRLGVEGATNLEWHADYSYVATPAKTSFLNAVELPAEPPRTYFTDMYNAFATLDPELQDRLRGLRATHSIGDYMAEPDKGFDAKVERDKAAGLERPAIPEAEHPMVVRHPDTDDEILYVSRGITKQIVGLERAESSALLKQLHLHATQPEQVYGHQWEVGDLIMFDTLGTMHRRDAWNPTERRLMRQLSTACIV
ncbi:MAG: alpha-ketoglutarate-dependent taurine dioxygenase [Acidimicrobiales bacterium]|jgi:alpha-ketoglutarate-dependent taurine dioxygenase